MPSLRICAIILIEIQALKGVLAGRNSLQQSHLVHQTYEDFERNFDANF